MNKNVISIILIIFGGYLLIGNTIFSLLLNFAGPIGFAIPINSEEYWTNWWMNYGLLTIILAVLGIVLIILGMNMRKKKIQLGVST